MKIIIAGCDGLIGSVVTQHLIKSHDVVLLDVKRGHDLTDESFVKDFLYRERADAIVNLFAFNDHVAPGVKRGTIFDIDSTSFSTFMNVNVTTLFNVCREFARNNPDSVIVNFGASTGLVSARTDMYGGAHKHPGYSTSKAAVIHLTKILAAHFASVNVRVNCISPGGIAHTQDESFKKLYGSHTPAGRMMNVEEVLPAIDFCLDKNNSYMTGANIVVDGGWTII